MVKFVKKTSTGARSVFNKIAVVEFKYGPMELTEKAKDINPIGFQVIGYRVDDDGSWNYFSIFNNFFFFLRNGI